MASIAILEQSSATLDYSLETIFQSGEKFRKSLSSIKKVYEASVAITNNMNDGTLSYPPIEEKKDNITPNGGKGMSFELKYVSSLHHQFWKLPYSFIVYNLLGTSHSLIQVAKTR